MILTVYNFIYKSFLYCIFTSLCSELCTYVGLLFNVQLIPLSTGIGYVLLYFNIKIKLAFSFISFTDTKMSTTTAIELILTHHRLVKLYWKMFHDYVYSPNGPGVRKIFLR